MSDPMIFPNDPGASPRADKVRQKYQGLQSLLGENSRLLEIMADLEADLRFLPLGSASLVHQIQSLLEGTLLMIEDLNRLADDRYGALYKVYLKIEKKVLQTLQESRTLSPQRWVIPLSEVGSAGEAEVGGKAARLGELKKAFPELIPDGFVATTHTYRTWMSEPLVATEIRALLDTLEVSSDRERFSSKAARIREIIERTSPPQPVQDSILSFARDRWPPSQRWAVRSSAVGEDGHSSFAGQFASFLNVPTPRLIEAYQGVLASRFNERAISYRLLGGFTEAETPMAVLFMPVIEARKAGVLYTRDPARPGEDQMLISSTWGLAADLVAGQAPADLFRVGRREPPEILETRLAPKKYRLIPGERSPIDRQENTYEDQNAPSLDPDEISRLAALALAVEKQFAAPQDIEWALGPKGRFWILQARPLRLVAELSEDERQAARERPILSGGLTIFPGRAVAPILVISDPKDLSSVPQGVILVVPQATPEVSTVLDHLAGFIAEQGHPAGHAATLLREFAIPSLFEVHGATRKLSSGTMAGLDATRRQVFSGIPWPGIQERTRARLAKPKPASPSPPLSDLILNLRMTDPMARSFKPESCRSIHDLIRFIHEKGVAALFEVGDQEARRKGALARSLVSSIPLHILVLDLGNALSPGVLPGQEVAPEEIFSTPFQALWRGIAHPRVSWAGRRKMSVKGFASVVASSLSQDMGAMRKLGDPNYLLVAPDYMSLNIRLAYHYAMIDALVGAVAENNYVNFRFRGGGGSPPRRDLRARFLTEVLTRSRFHADRRGDLVTAWLRRYPRGPAEAGLELLGKLMACARQLDMLMESESTMLHFVECFLSEDFEAFA